MPPARSPRPARHALLAALLTTGCAARAPAPTRSPAAAPTPCAAAAPTAGVAGAPHAYLPRLQRDARAVEALVRNAWVRDFVRAAAELPAVAPRVVYRNGSGTRFFAARAAAAQDTDTRRALWARTHDEEFYYTTNYGSPLSYARALDLLADAGFAGPAGRRVLDFGYGGVGHLRMLAALGADATGVDVDPLLLALYSEPGDQGPVRGAGGRTGRVTLVEGRFPADAATARAVGGRYDLIVSKNVLKRGYIHPEQPVEDRQRIDLGVDDAAFVRTLFDALVPGGWVMLYNVYPPQRGAYRPWADGRSPFPRAMWEQAGFRVAAFEQDDSAALRTLAHALGWDTDEPGVDLAADYFAMYTLVQRPQ